MTVFLHSSKYSLLKRRTYYGFCTQIMVFTFFRATAGSLGLTTPLVVVPSQNFRICKGTGFEVDIKPFFRHSPSSTHN